MVRQSLLLLVMLTTAPFSAATETFSFQSYQQGVLRMTLISPSLDGELLLRRGEQFEPLNNIVLERLFGATLPMADRRQHSLLVFTGATAAQCNHSCPVLRHCTFGTTTTSPCPDI